MLAASAQRARAERDGIVPPGDDLRALRFFHAGRDGQRVYWRGGWWVYADGDWWKERPTWKVDAEQATRAVSLGSATQKKFDAAPSWADIIARFGEHGAVRNARGQVVGYRYPRHADPEKQRKVNAEVLSLWEKHTQVSTELGLEESARHEAVTLVDRSSGRTVSAHPATAEKKAKKLGMVEARRRRLRVRKSGGSE